MSNDTQSDATRSKCLALCHDARAEAEHLFEGLFFPLADASEQIGLEIVEDSQLLDDPQKTPALILCNRSLGYSVAVIPIVSPWLTYPASQYGVLSLDADDYKEFFNLREALKHAGRIAVDEHINRRLEARFSRGDSRILPALAS